MTDNNANQRMFGQFSRAERYGQTDEPEYKTFADHCADQYAETVKAGGQAGNYATTDSKEAYEQRERIKAEINYGYAREHAAYKRGFKTGVLYGAIGLVVAVVCIVIIAGVAT